MNYHVFIFSRREIKIVILGTVFGGILQLVCWKYIKDHPELLNSENSEKLEPKTRFFPRGGAIMELIGTKIVFNVAPTIIFLAKNGIPLGALLSGSFVVLKKIPQTAVSTVLREALPTQHSDYGKAIVLDDRKKIALDQCESFGYLFNILCDKGIPFKEKKELSFNIIIDRLDLSTTAGRVKFVICVVSIIQMLAAYDISSCFLIMQNLIDAIKNGKISKRLARLIVRRLLKLKIDVHPDLLDAVADS